MTTTIDSPLKVADGYVRAWLAGDVETALSFVTDDIKCQAPGGQIEGKDAYRQFLTPFARSVINGGLIGLLADDAHATAVYAVDLPFARDYRGVEHLTVDNGKITHAISVFDLAPVIQAGAYPQG